AWFATAERGTASASFNSAQYFASAMFAPLTGWITYRFGWPYVFFVMGGLGVIITLVWKTTIYSPKDHPRISPGELEHIQRGGGLVDMDQEAKARLAAAGPKRAYLAQ